MQGRSNNAHNQTSPDLKPTKTSKTMDVTLVMKTKGSRRVQTTTNKVETRKDKLDLTAILYSGATGTKMIFSLSQ